jgi:hypothetical protein
MVCKNRKEKAMVEPKEGAEKEGTEEKDRGREGQKRASHQPVSFYGFGILRSTVYQTRQRIKADFI